METLTLTYRETYERLGISRRQFFRLLKAGALDHLRAPIAERFAKAKVDAWINGTDRRPWALRRAS